MPTISIDDKEYNTYHTFVIQCDQRDELKKNLLDIFIGDILLMFEENASKVSHLLNSFILSNKCEVHCHLKSLWYNQLEYSKYRICTAIAMENRSR